MGPGRQVAIPLLLPDSQVEINPGGVSHFGPNVPCTEEVLLFFFFQVKKLQVDKELVEKKNEEIAGKFLSFLCQWIFYVMSRVPLPYCDFNF